MAGTAVYMTSYPRLQSAIPMSMEARPWLYQHPQGILTKASNGASDFGNKFGQPIITGSLLTFEHQEDDKATRYGYDKVIMLAGGLVMLDNVMLSKRSPRQERRLWYWVVTTTVLVWVVVL